MAVQAARERQQTKLFKVQYAIRSGIEGTIGLRLRISLACAEADIVGLSKRIFRVHA